MTDKNEFLAQYKHSTRRIYEYVLEEAEWFLDKPLSLFSHSDIVYYQEQLSDQSPATVSRKLSTLGAYFKYLNIIGERPDNPVRGIRRPSVDPVRSVKWLTDQEIHALIAASSTDARSLALVWVALHGLRVAEIVGLSVDQYTDGTLWNIMGKGDKSRSIPLAREAQIALNSYLGRRRNGPLFQSNRGRLSYRSAQNMVYALTEKIGHRVSIHALRHTYGTRAIRKGVNEITLSKLMGHSSTRTTAKYVHLDTTDLRSANETVYPTEGLTVIKGGKARVS